MKDAFGIEILIGDTVFIENPLKRYTKATVQKISKTFVYCLYYIEGYEQSFICRKYPERVIVDLTCRQ